MRATPTADRAPLWNIRKEKRLATGALNELYIYIYIHTYTREAFLRSFSPGHLGSTTLRGTYDAYIRTYARTTAPRAGIPNA